MRLKCRHCAFYFFKKNDTFVKRHINNIHVSIEEQYRGQLRYMLKKRKRKCDNAFLGNRAEFRNGCIAFVCMHALLHLYQIVNEKCVNKYTELYSNRAITNSLGRRTVIKLKVCVFFCLFHCTKKVDRFTLVLFYLVSNENASR